MRDKWDKNRRTPPPSLSPTAPPTSTAHSEPAARTREVKKTFLITFTFSKCQRSFITFSKCQWIWISFAFPKCEKGQRKFTQLYHQEEEQGFIGISDPLSHPRLGIRMVKFDSAQLFTIVVLELYHLSDTKFQNSSQMIAFKGPFRQHQQAPSVKSNHYKSKAWFCFQNLRQVRSFLKFLLIWY